jgi:hypothetical protein
MKSKRHFGLFAAALAAVTLGSAEVVRSQEATEVGNATVQDEALLSADQLDELLAPVALFPDTLLAQVLFAATYPFDVVKAGRFVEQNAALPDKDRAALVETAAWDPSVQALTAGFPDLVTRMSDHIDWTEQVGDAVLVQTDDVMDSVQRLRDQAAETGYLTTNDAQTVSVDVDNTISIAPTDPNVVYVPAYDPQVVYSTPAPAQVVYVDDGAGTDFGDALATGAIVFGTAMVLDNIFDDNDPWDNYWRGPSHVDWNNHDFNPRPNIDINGDLNIGSNNTISGGNRLTNIDRDQVKIDRDKVKIDRDGVRDKVGDGGRDGAQQRIGNLDRDGIDRTRDRSFKPDTDKRAAARDKMTARKAAGRDVATLPAAVTRRDQAGVQGGDAKTKIANAPRPAKVNTPVAARNQEKIGKPAAAKRPANVSKPKAASRPAAHKAPAKSSAFKQSGGSRAKAASHRGKASGGKRKR